MVLSTEHVEEAVIRANCPLMELALAGCRVQGVSAGSVVVQSYILSEDYCFK